MELASAILSFLYPNPVIKFDTIKTKENVKKVNQNTVLSYFEDNQVLDHYEEATRKIGLWKSEEIILRHTFPSFTSRILELGCGVGRISFSLWMLGYNNLTATDISRKMIKRALKIHHERKTDIVFYDEDATALKFDRNLFEGIIFGFNGLMQIPERKNRKKAIRECYRVLKPGGHFVFTTHDRSVPKWKKFWENEQKKWRVGIQDKALLEFGDRYGETPNGRLFIHVPDASEIRKDLKEVGFLIQRDVLRSRVSEESQLVKDFSDECRFWIARKPLTER